MQEQTERRLCDYVDVVENNRNCVILETKKETSPRDLIALGCFNGNEKLFRVSKDPDTITVSMFAEDKDPVTVSYGNSTTIAREDIMRARDQILECVNLDFGIFTNGRRVDGLSFDELASATLEARDLESPRSYKLVRGDGVGTLRVNNQYIIQKNLPELDVWLARKGQTLKPEVSQKQGKFTQEYGRILRVGPSRELDEMRQAPVGEIAQEAKKRTMERNSSSPDVPKGAKRQDRER